MLYTHTAPEQQGDRIHLYRDIQDLPDGGGRAVFAVALALDVRCRVVVPLWTDPWEFDPAWVAPAEVHADDSVTARGPVPKALFLRLDPDPDAPAKVLRVF